MNEKQELMKKAEKMLRKGTVVAISINNEECIVYSPTQNEIIPKVLLIEWIYKESILKYIKVNNNYKLLMNGKEVSLAKEDKIQFFISVHESNNKIFINYCGELCYVTYKNRDVNYSSTVYFEDEEHQVSLLLSQNNEKTQQSTNNSFLEELKNKSLSEMMRRYFKVENFESGVSYEK